MAIITLFSFNKAYRETKDFAYGFRTQEEEMGSNEKPFAYGFRTQDPGSLQYSCSVGKPAVMKEAGKLSDMLKLWKYMYEI